MGKQHKIPTLVVLLFLVIGVITGVFLVQEQQYFRLSASNEAAPKDVRITNITETSFSVSFYTDKPSISTVLYGETELENFASSGSKDLQNLHYITVKNLEPNTNYKFKIISGSQEFSNNGVPWRVQTAALISEELIPNLQIISGNVQTKDGKPASNALVYIQIGGASSVSTQASSEGVFLIPLAELRTQIQDRYFTVDGQELVNIFVQGGSMGAASVQAILSKANLLPTITLGNSYDFTDIESSVTGSLPNAEISLPESDTQESRFELSNTPPRIRRN